MASKGYLTGYADTRGGGQGKTKMQGEAVWVRTKYACAKIRARFRYWVALEEQGGWVKQTPDKQQSEQDLSWDQLLGLNLALRT